MRILPVTLSAPSWVCRRETAFPMFDATAQIDAARDAQAKYDDLGHQVEQKRAQNRADAEKRAVDLKSAEGDLAKAGKGSSAKSK